MVVGPTTRVRLRVSPGAARAAVVGRHGEAWKVRVAAARNERHARPWHCERLGEQREDGLVRLPTFRGGGSRDKIVELAGIEPDEIERRLATAGGQETR